MSAITQCPQCGTRFRVVPDQLKISQGWVRCGKCAEVFNAREALDAAAALKSGQPAPPAATHAAPHQVSIVLRQQALASDIDVPTGAAPVPGSETAGAAVSPVTDEPTPSPQGAALGTVALHADLAEDVQALLDVSPSGGELTAEPDADAGAVSAGSKSAITGSADPTASLVQPAPEVPEETPVVASVEVGAKIDFLLDDTPQPPHWLLRTDVAPMALSGLSAQPVAHPTEQLSGVAEPVTELENGVVVLQQAMAGWTRSEATPPADVGLAVPGGESAEALAACAAIDTHLPVDVLIEPDSPPAPHAQAPASPDDSWGSSPETPSPPDLPHAVQPEVGFVRQARRQAFWASGPVRAALGALVLFTLGLLLLQVTVHERNRLAALFPTVKPLLEQLCEPMGCEVGLFQQIESVEIVSTELIKAKDGSYRFELVLRNASALPVALPAIELSLTDRHGEVALRRVLLPEDWADAAESLAPSAETALAARLALVNPDELRMEGFRAVVFYP